MCLSSFPPGKCQDGSSFRLQLFPSATLAIHHSPDMMPVTLRKSVILTELSNCKKESLEGWFLALLFLMCLWWHALLVVLWKSVFHFCLSSVRSESPNSLLWFLFSWFLYLVLVFPVVIYSYVCIPNTLTFLIWPFFFCCFSRRSFLIPWFHILWLLCFLVAYRNYVS